MSCFAAVGLLVAAFAGAQTTSQLPLSPISTQQSLQTAKLDDDESYRPKLKSPAYSENGPIVIVDEGHRNYRFTHGLARLLSADGYSVRPWKKPFTYGLLNSASVLVILNPGIFIAPARSVPSAPAITEQEAALIHDWIAGGGSLLLGGASREDALPLSRRLGVEFASGHVVDPALLGSSARTGDSNRNLSYIFSASLLATHAIITGRSADEQVKTVALELVSRIEKTPAGALILLHCSDQATIVRPDPLQAQQMKQLKAAIAAGQNPDLHNIKIDAAPVPVSDAIPQAPVAIAFTIGKGRVVLLGDGMSLSAIASQMKVNDEIFKRNYGLTEADNQQFALNIVHWLSGLLN